MKSATFVLGSLLATVAMAQPHRHSHNARHDNIHAKRDTTVVWVTDYDYVTETIDVTTTIWVSEGFVPPTDTPATTTSPSATSSSGAAAQFFEPDTQPASTSTTFSLVYVAPTTTSVDVPPPTEAAPVPTTTSTTPVVVAPVPAPEPTTSTTTTPVAVVVEPTEVAQPTTTTEAAAPVASSSSESSTESESSSSSYGAETSGCTDSTPCSGDITYYTAGLGACGTTVDGDTTNVVALPYALMGTASNNNQYCGQTITIQCTATGKTTTATVVDKCMGCTGYSIDLSNAAFLDLDDLSVGRTTATWWFN